MKKSVIIGAAAAFVAAAASTIAITISSKEKKTPEVVQIPQPKEGTRISHERIRPFFVIPDAYNRRIILTTDGCIEHYEDENLVSSESIKGWPTGNFVIEVIKNTPYNNYWFLFTDADGEGGFRRAELEANYYAANHIMLLSPRLEPLPLYDKGYRDSRNEKRSENYPITGHDCVLAAMARESLDNIRACELSFFGDGDQANSLTVVSFYDNVYHSFKLDEYRPESRCHYGASLLLEKDDSYAIIRVNADGSNIKLNRCTVHDISGKHNYKRFVANVRHCDAESFDAFYTRTEDTL